MRTESDKRKLLWFLGALAVIALVINAFFLNLSNHSWGIPEPRPIQVSSLKIERESKTTNNDAKQQLELERARSNAAKEEHARYLARYLNKAFEKTAGVEPFALCVAEGDKLNGVFNNELALRFKTNSLEILPSFFKPAFVSDKLFDNVFEGSREALTRLEVSKSLDGLLLARETVRYMTNDPSLLNVLTANIELHIKIIPINLAVHEANWNFSASGAGFNLPNARSMAEDRIMKQISTNASMTIIRDTKPQ